MSPAIASSRVPLVAKGHTGALFLLIEIFGAAFGKGLGNMYRRSEESLMAQNQVKAVKVSSVAAS